MNKEKLKEAVCQAIEQEKARNIGWAKEIAGQPELGFKKIKPPNSSVRCSTAWACPPGAESL